MAYQALARKWRPKKFADLVGQEHVVGALQNALKQGRLHHAYLLTGTRGVGKTTIARILAKSLNCEQGVGGEPCGVCSACTQIDAGRFVDLLEIDAASNTGIDNIREVLENAQYMPTSGRYKVYIIDEVHMLSKSAFNAMLKTLEEPPEHVKFILATTDPHKVPITVLSRCLQFVLRNMTTQQISSHLAHILNEEKIVYEEDALTILARAGAGSMRDALSLLDQAIALGSNKVTEDNVRHMLGAVDRRYLFGLLSSIVAQDGETLMKQAEALSAQAVGFGNTLTEMAALLQQLALVQAVPSVFSNEDHELKESLTSFARALSAEQIQLYYQCVLQGKKDLPLAPDEYAGFVMTLLRMLAFAPLAAQPEQIDWQVENTQLNTPESNLINKEIPRSPLIDKKEEEGKDFLVKKNVEMSPEIEEETLKEVNNKSANILTAEPISASNVEEVVNFSTASQSELDSVDLPWAVDHEDNDSIDCSIEKMEHEVVTKEETQEIEQDKEYVELSVSQIVTESIEINSFEQEENNHTISPSEATPIELSDDLTSNDFAIALPDLTIDNWADIVSLLKPKLGAAQMLLKNAVLTKVEGQVIYLAVSDQAVNSAEIIAKVGHILSEAYDVKWTIHTQALVLGQETPNMKIQKQKEQDKAEAQAYLQADPIALALMDALDGQWLSDTIELKP